MPLANTGYFNTCVKTLFVGIFIDATKCRSLAVMTSLTHCHLVALASHSYLTGVTAAQLLRHLSNMNVISMANVCFDNSGKQENNGTQGLA